MAFGLARFDLTTITRTLELPEVTADPAAPLTLVLRYCGIGNRDWEAWQFARDAASPVEKEPKEDAPVPLAERIRDNRTFWRDQLAAVGLVGWANVADDGKPAAFSADAAARFLAELYDKAPDVLTRIADYAATRSNFRGSQPAADPVALGKG